MTAARSCRASPSTSASAPPKPSECTAPARCAFREPQPPRSHHAALIRKTTVQGRGVRPHGVLVNGPAADKPADSLIFHGDSSTAAPVDRRWPFVRALQRYDSGRCSHSWRLDEAIGYKEYTLRRSTDGACNGNQLRQAGNDCPAEPSHERSGEHGCVESLRCAARGSIPSLPRSGLARSLASSG